MTRNMFVDKLDDLKRQCAIGQGEYAPHAHQWIGALPQIVEAINGSGWGPVRAKPDQAIILLGIDGLAFDVAASCWKPDLLLPLTSVFPSTSTSSWLSMLTGVSVDHHGLAGVVYRLRGEKLYNAISDRTTDGTTPSEAPFLSAPNLFIRLAGRRPCITLPGDLQLYPGRWRDALLSGSQQIWPRGGWVDRRTDPSAAVAACARDVSELLTQQSGSAPLIWAFVNLDDYVHRNGYDASVRLALREFDEQIRGWCEQGAIVVAISDHGMTRVAAPQAKVERWSELDRDHGRLASGGAGRVRWMYPKPGHTDLMLSALRTEFSDVARICRARELAQLGLLGVCDASVLARIGEIVAIATDAAFPTAGEPCLFDHGSVTEGEMFVPLAIWQGKGSG